MSVDRSRLGFVAAVVTFAVSLSVSHRGAAQTGPSRRITVYKEPT